LKRLIFLILIKLNNIIFNVNYIHDYITVFKKTICIYNINLSVCVIFFFFEIKNSIIIINLNYIYTCILLVTQCGINLLFFFNRNFIRFKILEINFEFKVFDGALMRSKWIWIFYLCILSLFSLFFFSYS